MNSAGRNTRTPHATETDMQDAVAVTGDADDAIARRNSLDAANIAGGVGNSIPDATAHLSETVTQSAPNQRSLTTVQKSPVDSRTSESIGDSDIAVFQGPPTTFTLQGIDIVQNTEHFLAFVGGAVETSWLVPAVVSSEVDFASGTLTPSMEVSISDNGSSHGSVAFTVAHEHLFQVRNNIHTNRKDLNEEVASYVVKSNTYPVWPRSRVGDVHPSRHLTY